MFYIRTTTSYHNAYFLNPSFENYDKTITTNNDIGHYLKMGQPRPLFLFIFILSTCHNLNSNLNRKKRGWCAWDSNPGWQDGRRKQIH